MADKIKRGGKSAGPAAAAAAGTEFAANYPGAAVIPSPNFSERRGEGGINMLILHYTGMPAAPAALAHLADPAPADNAPVSAHYVVAEDGAIVQMVAESARAWHAGLSYWRGERDINSRSIGIEIVNPGIIPLANGEESQPLYPPAQIEAVIKLCRFICRRYHIAARNVLGHSDIAPERKTDPGQAFPWQQLAAAGIGHYVPPAPIAAGPQYGPGQSGRPIAALQAMLALYGYNIAVNGEYDAQTKLVIAAFQRHFRPARVDGIADFSTLETLRALLLALPPPAA